MEKYSPITYALVLDNRPLQWSYGISYFALALLLYSLSFYFYKKRKIEVTSEAIAYSNLRVVFKYGVTTCVMLFGGVYFSEVQNTDLTWIIFGYCLGAMIGYFIAEMVLQKTWRIFGNLKGLIVYGIIVTVTIVFVQSLGFYEKKLPKQEDIKSVILTNQPYVFSDKSESYAPYFVPSELESKNNIKEVLELHKQIIADKSLNQKLQEGQYEIAFFLYTLNDGSQISRQYRINQELYEDSYRNIHESKEYKQASNEIFHLNVEKINQIKISSNSFSNHFVTLSNSQQIAEAIAALKQDILSESYLDERYFEGRGSGIEIFFGKDRSVYLNHKPNYEHFTQWLIQNDLFEQASVQADDVEKIVVADLKMDPFTDQYNDPQLFINEIENQKEKLTITDKKQIELCLAQASSMPNHKYSAVFYYKGEHLAETYFFDEEHAPDFIKQHFK
ncbi:DUF6449 domain-containing protein [Bacillus sp. T3]|uniref:DUF6449 domain-containing protein n=1 Tax=Bacillus sp. T3 TaxID=467262 RepID=UPI002980B904|nr:DUF6449 domain-containing protein [Bacillus sp. T3]